jgi:phospholipase/carboxylesterase
MDEAALDDLTRLLPPLLASMEGARLAARQIGPGALTPLSEALAPGLVPLREALEAMRPWPAAMQSVRTRFIQAAQATLGVLEEFVAAGQADDLGRAYKALRGLTDAQFALYPIAGSLPALSKFFLPEAARDNHGLLEKLAQSGRPAGRGLMQSHEEARTRGGFVLYAPEWLPEGAPAPLVVALHGGMGSGASFIWNWLAAARAHGAILIAPTARGRTWSLTGEDVDTPNLRDILAFARARWPIDTRRMLLSGMSDGGTFTYVTGLIEGCPFTHLAPMSAAFHPMLVAGADSARLAGLPIHIVHGGDDWMFPPEMARQARDALGRAGAHVVYQEIDDLGHNHASEYCAALLDWMDGAR